MKAEMNEEMRRRIIDVLDTVHSASPSDLQAILRGTPGNVFIALDELIREGVVAETEGRMSLIGAPEERREVVGPKKRYDANVLHSTAWNDCGGVD